MPNTIIFIHGAGGGGWEYELWRPHFAAAGYRIIAPDLLPAAGSIAETQLDDYLAQVRAWIPPGERVILAGASMGGLLALKAAEMVDPLALVLINSVPPAGVGPSRAGKEYPPVIQWADGTREETQEALFDSDEATVDWAWPRWRNESGAVLSQIAAGVPVERPHCPTLAVLSEGDTDIPYQTGLELARWAGADALLYHGMSHVGPLLSRRAAEVAQSILVWCQQR